MKKLWILAMILLAVGCSKTEDGGIIPESTLSTVLYGVIEDGNEDEEDETRVYLDNKIRIRWNKSDLITVFNGTTRNQKYEYLGRDGSTGGEFDVVPSESLGAGNAVEHIYALYPYDRFTEYCYAEDDLESDYIVYTVPAEQTYKTNSIGLNSNLMVAVTPKDGDGTLVFRNVCSYLRLKFYGKDQEVRSIVLKGNAGEVLSGDAAITPVYGGIPTIKMLAEAGDDNQTITLNCPESVTVGSTKEEATEFWMVVPPFNFSQGFTITVYGDDNKSQEYIFNNNLTFERNTYNTITRELTSYNIHIPGNQIWYTSTDGKIVEPSNAKAFGANVVSNVYEDGKGVITFDKVVTGIGYGAFSEIQNFKSVTISDDVKTVNDLAIYYCHNLEAFYGKFSSDDNRCLIVDGKLTAFAPSDLVSYDIPETVTEIGNAVFKGISGLEQINIPNTVTTIHGQAFHACWDLKSVTIPESVVDIREGAFTYCRRLTAFYGKYASSDNKALIVDDVFIAFARGCSDTIYTIPDGVTAIGSGAFYGNSDIVEVVFPNSLTRIVRGAFSGCSSMKNVTIPENVTTIEENAFCGIGLESVICKPTTPPAGAEEMFKEMNSSAKIYVPAESVEAYKAADYWKDYADIIEPYNPEDFSNSQIHYTATEKVEPYNKDAFGVAIVSNEWDSTTGEGVITFDGEVTKIGQSAFMDCTSLTSLTIPDSVIKIETIPFYRCCNLVAFYGKYASSDNRCLVVDGELYAFAPAGLTEYTIIDNVTKIGYTAFGDCSNLTSITIPSSITGIGMRAFYGCSSLVNLTIPDSVTWIGWAALENCSSLKNITIGHGVTAIDSHAFDGCSSLTSVTIPDSVIRIESYAFEDCKKLTSVYCKPTIPPTGGTLMFINNASGRKIYVPAGSVDAYKAADGWKDYADYIFADPDSVEEEDGNSFNENHCIYYRANATGGWDTGYENYRRTESYITCGASGKTLEMKFKLSEFSGSSYVHLAASSNLAKDYCDELIIDNSSIELALRERDDEDDWVSVYHNSWKLADFGVSATDVITLRLSGETITINGKTLSCKNIPGMGWSYIFSNYYRERDEGEWKEYEGVPEGSELYYVKMLDADGEITYLGYPKYEYTATTGQKEYYWHSNTCDPQYANDYQNQGHYTGNF